MCKMHHLTRRCRVLFSRTAAVALPLLVVMLLLSRTAFAQNTYVITDGDRVLVHTTYATDPAAVLDEAGLELGEEDTYTTQQGNGVSEILVRRVQTVSINHCGEEMTAESYGETVGELLDRLHVETGGDTRVSVPLETETYDGMTLEVSRTIRTEQTYTTAIPHGTVTCEDASLPEGESQVLTAGQDGEMLCTAEVTYRDGKEISRTVLNQQVSRHPVDEVIAVGTGPIPTEAPEIRETVQPEDFSDTPAIAENTITTSTGEVLTYTDVMHVVATGYNSSNEGCDAYTATGTLARVGAIAVDPSVIPYGTRMYIVSDDGEYVYGIATAEDCGGSIVGNRVDLYFDTNAECFEFGVRDCTVYILG